MVSTWKGAARVNRSGVWAGKTDASIDPAAAPPHALALTMGPLVYPMEHVADHRPARTLSDRVPAEDERERCRQEPDGATGQRLHPQTLRARTY